MPPDCASSSCVTTLGGGFSDPSGVAVDGSGNVYVADAATSAVKEMPPGCTSSSLRHDAGRRLRRSLRAWQSTGAATSMSPISATTVSQEIMPHGVNFGTVPVGIHQLAVDPLLHLHRRRQRHHRVRAHPGRHRTRLRRCGHRNLRYQRDQPYLQRRRHLHRERDLRAEIRRCALWSGGAVRCQAARSRPRTSTAPARDRNSSSRAITTITTLGGGFGSPVGPGGGRKRQRLCRRLLRGPTAASASEMSPGCTSSSCVTTLGGGFSSLLVWRWTGAATSMSPITSNIAVKEMPAGLRVLQLRDDAGRRLQRSRRRGGGRERQRLCRRLRQQRGEGDARRLRVAPVASRRWAAASAIPAAWRWTGAATSMLPIRANDAVKEMPPGC